MSQRVIDLHRQVSCLLPVLCCSVIACLVSGCGPIYETQYSFIPPEDDHGRSCIFQCENGKLQCERLEDMKKDQCEDRSDRQYYRCQDRGEKYCYRESCSVDYETCESHYRGCYQSCGGRVDAKQVCVGFCNK